MPGGGIDATPNGMQRALSIALLSLVMVACQKAAPEQQAAQPSAPAPVPTEPAPPAADPAPTPDPSAGTPAEPGSAAQTDPAKAPAPIAKGEPNPATPAKTPAPIAKGEPNPGTPAKTPAPIAKGEPNPGTPSKGPGPRPRGPGLHQTCGTNDTCAFGMKCMTYYGIAGPRGPQFKTCEVPCDKATKCPSGTSCGVVADGPGNVCR